jgi:hypothetical protein
MLLRAGIVVAVIVAAAVAVNLALLSVATGGRDPVGRLSPVVTAGQTSPPLVRAQPLPPARGTDEDRKPDD